MDSLKEAKNILAVLFQQKIRMFKSYYFLFAYVALSTDITNGRGFSNKACL